MDLYKRVGELLEEYKDKITDKEFFTSNVYKQFVARKTRNILTGTFYTLERNGFSLSEYDENKLLNSIETNVHYDEQGKVGSYTHSDIMGNQFVDLNAADRDVLVQKDRVDRHLALQGVLYHEIGHILFTDFPTLRAWIHQLGRGQWFPNAPKRATSVSGINLASMMQTGPEYQKLIAKIADSIQNAGEDGYIEREIKLMFPGNGKECLAVLNEATERSMISFPKLLKSKEASVFQAIFDQILTYAKFGYMNLDGYDGEYSDVLYECADILDGFNHRDPLVRCAATNELLCVMQPYLDEEIERLKKEAEKKQQQQQSSSGKPGQPQNGQGQNQQSGNGSGQNGSNSGQQGQGQNQQNGNGSGQNGSNNGQQGQGQNQQNGNGSGQNGQNGGSSDLSKDIADQLSKMIDAMNKKIKATDHAKTGQTSHAVNNPNNARNKGAEQVQPKSSDGQNGGSGAGGNGNRPSTAAGKAELDNILNKMLSDKANAQAEKERTKELNKDNGTVYGDEYGVTDSSVEVIRASEVPQENIDAYEKAMEKLAPISRDLQRGINRVLKERREGGKRKNLPFGRRLEVSSIVHNDCRYFSRNKLPTESPKLGVGLLVDESGSTSGELIESAKCASILIEDFCRELDIPHIISGYTSAYSGYDATILSYAEPGTIDNKDSYRITGMSARNGTPTKAATLYMLQRLKQLPVDIRLLIVITDGESHDDRNGEIKKIIQTTNKHGILIIAAGIGSDRKKVEKEFGEENFINISDLDTMPEQLIRLIKDNIWV